MLLALTPSNCSTMSPSSYWSLTRVLDLLGKLTEKRTANTDRAVAEETLALEKALMGQVGATEAAATARTRIEQRETQARIANLVAQERDYQVTLDRLRDQDSEKSDGGLRRATADHH